MIDWSHIDKVFLDMDGTLLDLHFDNRFWREHVPARFAAARGLDLAQAREELLARYRDRDRGSSCPTGCIGWEQRDRGICRAGPDRWRPAR